MSVSDKIIMALDVSSIEKAKELVMLLEEQITFYKVGFELFTAGWFYIVDWILCRGHDVMIDLKFFDIPETVASTLNQFNNRGIKFITVHGNDTILKAAAEAKQDLNVLAVTCLTSFDNESMREMGFYGNINNFVLNRTKRALEIGCDGVVCSGLEVQHLRRNIKDKFFVVTPGIRPGKNIMETDNQKRIVTAKEALMWGADYVVIGRPIKNAKDPLGVVENLIKGV